VQPNPGESLVNKTAPSTPLEARLVDDDSGFFGCYALAHNL
jgi:hypothetical protein